ncbi:START domain-containing protein [Pseudomonadota bacterium]
MKAFLGYSTLLFLILLPDYCTADWIPVKEKEGIQIYTRKVTGTPPVMAKGIVIINAKPAAILAVLDNNSNHPKWIPYLQASRKLQTVSDTERLEYNLFDAPWPASNRDFVFRVKAIPSNRKDILIYSMKSEFSPLMPEQKNIVRGTLHESTFKLTQLGTDKTKVELLFQADPRGWIPNWIVNIVQRAWPYKVLKGLRAQTLSDKQHGEVATAERLLH